MITCCDFCTTQAEGDAHWAKWRNQYGRTAAGTVLVAPPGWQILPFGDEVPSAHREYIAGAGWAGPRTCRSTITPLHARPSGSVLAYAVPKEPT